MIINNKYPIYIVSKGRAKSCLTARTLNKMGTSYKIVIEPQEYNEYSKYILKEKILVLPFSNLGQGSIPARNWIWEHAISINSKKHWILDDNIRYFYRLNKNSKVVIISNIIFKCAEDFTDRFKNVVLSGFNYDYFCASICYYPPYYLNTRIYSCILIKNDLPFRWRGTYNEDTDLSLTALKEGYCTILFNAFLAGKTPTLTMKGGNADILYKADGRRKMAESLKDQHPDVTKIKWKWNRWQHEVNYRKFKRNRLIYCDNIKVEDKINEYGMILRDKILKDKINWDCLDKV